MDIEEYLKRYEGDEEAQKRLAEGRKWLEEIGCYYFYTYDLIVSK